MKVKVVPLEEEEILKTFFPAWVIFKLMNWVRTCLAMVHFRYFRGAVV